MRIALLALLTLAIPEEIFSCRPEPPAFANLGESLYHRLKSDEEVLDDAYCGIGGAESESIARLHLNRVRNELNECANAQTEAEKAKTVGTAAAQFVVGVLSFGFPPIGLLPLSLTSMISTGGCSSREFMESLVGFKIAEYHTRHQDDLVKGWRRSYGRILLDENRFHQLLSLNLDMSNAHYIFLSTDQNLKEHSALIARDYLNARMLLLSEIITASSTPKQNVEYRRQLLGVIKEVVVYVKEAVELVRRRQYVTSKEVEVTEVRRDCWPDEKCEWGMHEYGDTGHEMYMKRCTPVTRCSSRRIEVTKYSYNEEEYADVFKANACPIIELERASIPVTQWKAIVRELVAYPGVCNSGVFDCYSVKRQLE